MKNQENLQQRQIELQMLEQQMQHIQKQLQLLDQQAQDLAITIEAIDDISKSKPGKEILVPVNSGIFLKGELKETEDFIINVGANVAVKKSSAETKKLIEDQLIEIKNFKQRLKANMDKLSSKAMDIEKSFAELIK